MSGRSAIPLLALCALSACVASEETPSPIGGDADCPPGLIYVVRQDRPDWSADERRLRTGLRQVRMRRWIASVNGERLFLKGANQGPTRMAIAEATPAVMDQALVVKLTRSRSPRRKYSRSFSTQMRARGYCATADAGVANSAARRHASAQSRASLM